MSDPIQTILADDHELVLEGLTNLLEQHSDIEVVAVAHDGDELLELLEVHKVDVVIVDLQMPYHGMAALAEIRKRQLPVRVLVLTAFGDGESIQQALELKAEGFALKTESPSQTIEAIRQVAQGRLVFPRSAQRWFAARREQSEDRPGKLSLRETEVLTLLAQGLTNIAIAKQLEVTENTIRFHLKNIYAKLHVVNRTEAVAWFFQQGANLTN